MRVLPGDFPDENMPEIADIFAGIMVSDFRCDQCDEMTEAERKFVVRSPRRSDPSDWSGILWLCPACGEGTGAKTEAQWDAWIVSDEARELGAEFLS